MMFMEVSLALRPKLTFYISGMWHVSIILILETVGPTELFTNQSQFIITHPFPGDLIVFNW